MFPRPTNRTDAAALDRTDPLAACRDLFDLPQGVIYLVGHSLGPPVKSSLARVAAATDAWRNGLVRSWNTAGWIDLAERTGDRIAALIGAAPGEVIVTDNVSVNLFKLAAAALGVSKRRVLIIEDDEFPTDQYIAGALAQQLGCALERVPTGNGRAALQKGGVLIKSAVNYRSSEVADVAVHEAVARKAGGLIVWDLSHAAGVLDLRLKERGALLATGCTYKYLNAGPGAPAFLFVSRAAPDSLRTPLPGWMGHAAPFAFDSNYVPRDGAAQFASGTPPILSLAALDGALDAHAPERSAAGESKARQLGALAIARARDMGLEVISPYEDPRRGGHVSLRIREGYPVVQALAAQGVLADFRAPDTVRFGFSPLFLRYTDVWDTFDNLEDILRKGSWAAPEFQVPAKVT